MVWPLRSTPITGASSLLRASPPTLPASVLNTSQFLLLGGLPLTTRTGGRIGAGLPTFHAAAADQARVAFMPDTTWPIGGHPPGSSRRQPETPVSMSCSIISTRPQRFTHVRLPGPHLTPHWAPSPHRSPPRSHDRRSMRWFGASPRRATPKGQPSSAAQHRLRQRLPTRRTSNVRGTPSSRFFGGRRGAGPGG